MKRQWLLASFLVFLAGCGGSEHDELVEASIRQVNEAADILAGIHDAYSAQMAAPKLDQVIAELEAIDERTRALPRISQDAAKRLEAAHMKASREALERMNQNARKAAVLPGCDSVVLKFNWDIRRLTR